MVLVHQTAQEFFDLMLSQALQARSVVVQEPTRLYVLNLLAGLATTSDRHDIQLPMAQRWFQANQTKTSRAERVQLLRGIGDDALLLCGFWWQRVHRVYRQALDPQYHISMGQMSYRQITGSPFTELAEKFPAIIDVLIQISEASAFRTDEDVVRLIDLWRTTHSRYAAQALALEGIPVTALRAIVPS